MVFVKKTDGQVLTAANLNDNNAFTLSNQLVIYDNQVSNSDNDLEITGYNEVDSADFDATNTETLLSNAKQFIEGAAYDEYPSVDTTKWAVTGIHSGVDAGVYIALNQLGLTNGTLISEGSSLDFDMSSSDCAVKVYVYLHTDTNNSGSEAIFQLSDGSNHVNITRVSGNVSTSAGYWEFVFNTSAQTVNVWKDSVVVHSDLDISSLSNYFFRFDVSGGNPGEVSRARIYKFQKVEDGTVKSMSYDSQTVAGDTFLTVPFTTSSGTGDITHEYSIDDGSNWISYTGKTLVESTFTELKFKVTATYALDTTIQNIVEMNKILYYNS